MATRKVNVISALLICISWIITACSGIPRQVRSFKGNHMGSLDNLALKDTVPQTSQPSVSALHCALLCVSSQPRCAIFTYRQNEATCVTSSVLCTKDHADLVAAPGVRYFAMDYGSQGVLSCPSPSQALTPSVDVYNTTETGLITQVSVGPKGVWGVTDTFQTVYRKHTYTDPTSGGKAWLLDSLGSDKLWAYIDVGNMVCGVETEPAVFQKSQDNSTDPLTNPWVPTPLTGVLQGITLRSVTCSPSGHVWVLTSTGDLYKVHPSGNVTKVGSDVRQMDAGHAGLWMVRPDKTIWYRQGTYLDTGAAGTGWLQVTGYLDNVSSGRDVVVGVNAQKMLWRRDNVTAANPLGTQWTLLSQGMRQAEVYGGWVWAVDNSGGVWQLPL